MKNIIEPIKAEIKKRLASAGIRATLTYPDDVPAMGNLYPIAVLVSDAFDILSTANMEIEANYTINVYIVTQAGIVQSKKHEDLLFEVLTAIFADNQLGGIVRNLEPTGIEFNAEIPYITDVMPNNALQKSMLKFQVNTGGAR